MLGSGPTGLVDGQNPIKTVVFRRGMYGILALIAGLGAAAVSPYLAPECVRVPSGCDDHFTFCANQAVFQPESDCKIQAGSCMKTCGCCTENPQGWCPNKVTTLKSIIDDNYISLLTFFGVYALLSLMSYWRLCSSSTSPEKRKILLYASISGVVVLCLMAGFWVVYLLTDCQDKFRGWSDVLMVTSALCSFFAFIQIFIAVASIPAIAQYGDLLTNMASHRSRGDPNILVLDVGADRARRFITEEEQHGVEFTVQTSRSSCLKCCRVWYYLYLAICLAVIVYFGGWKVFTTRGACFGIAFFSIFALLFIYLRVRRSQAYLDHQKHQVNQKWLQELQGPQQLILFCNDLADPNRANRQENPVGVACKSVISFGSGQVAGKTGFFFEPSTVAVPGAMQKTTYTRIVHAQDQTGDVLEFKIVVHQQTAGLLRTGVHVEAVARIPLEAHHVARVREWLADRRAIFEFETGPEVELLQA